MTRLADLEHLVTLSDARYRREQQSIQRVLAEENRLRASLRQLDLHLQESRQNCDEAQRALGADLLWHGWVGRKKTQLNQQLARLLVIKEQHLKQVRHAYGKLLVSQRIRDDAKSVQRKKRRDAALDQAIETAVFRK